MPFTNCLVIYIRCVDPDTMKGMLYKASCCHLERWALRCQTSPLDPTLSVDVELVDSEDLTRIRGMPGVLEANLCPAGIPELCDPETIRALILNSEWGHKACPH